MRRRDHRLRKIRTAGTCREPQPVQASADATPVPPGAVLFVERQIAHAWAGSVIGSVALFVIEVIQGLQALTLAPVLAIFGAMVFLFKAGTLSGQFYLTVFAYIATAALMAVFPDVGHLLFGGVSAAAFFFPGLKYYRQRKRAEASDAG